MSEPRTLVDDLVFAAAIAEAAGTDASKALAGRLDQAAERLRSEMEAAKPGVIKHPQQTRDKVAVLAVLTRINGGGPTPKGSDRDE